MEKIWKKNEEVRLRIEDLSREGDGIGHVDGYTLFVKNTVPGDCGTVRIIKAKKNYGYGIMTEIQEPSSWRTEPVCPVARPCGGCQMQHILYEKQLEWKRRKVQDCLERIGGLTGITVNPVIGMENPWHYRNKAQFPVGCDKEGKLTAGFYAMRSHSIISQEHCYIQDACNDEILKLVLEYMEENRVSAYEEQTGKGLVRHVITRIGKATGEIMAAMVINGEEIPCPDRLIERLRRVKGMTSICLNINRANTNVILGDRVKMLWGREYITDRIGDVRYRISLLSFYQVNPEQTRKLYETALEFAALTGTETVWDLYCGIGTISLFLAQKAKQVYGVEIVDRAVRDARQNAADNNIRNAEFFTGAAEEVLPEQFERSGGSMRADVIVVDPPRKGCEESLLNTIVEMEPERIVYVSCDPATLARDCGYLTGAGYRVEKVQPVDMFPMGYHVETVVRLSKKDR